MFCLLPWALSLLEGFCPCLSNIFVLSGAPFDFEQYRPEITESGLEPFAQLFGVSQNELLTETCKGPA